MNRITKQARRLMLGILTLLLIFGTVPVQAAGNAPTGGDNNGDPSTFDGATVQIPVIIENGGSVKIEPIDYVEDPNLPADEQPVARGFTLIPATQNSFLPNPSQKIPVPEGATGTALTITYDGARDATVYSYRITQDTDKPYTTYDETKSYLLDVYILYAYDSVKGSDKLYAVPILRYGEPNGSETEKPTECEFENIIHTPPTPHNAESWGRKGDKQSSDGSEDEVKKEGEVYFTPGDGELTKIQLIDPRTGNPTDATTVDAFAQDGKTKVGTYTLKGYDLKTGKAIIVFEPYPEFVGTPRPCKIQATDEHGYTAVAEYQPHVVAPPTPHDAETWGKQGDPQSSDDSETKIHFTPGDGELISIQLIDPHTGKPTDKTEVDALDKDGNVIGKYVLTGVDLKTGEAIVKFIPDPGFVGDPQPCGIIATDEYGYTATAYYQPHVKASKTPAPTKTPTKTPTPSRTTAAKNAVKTGDDFNALPYILGIAAAIIVLIIIIVAVRRRKRKDDESCEGRSEE